MATYGVLSTGFYAKPLTVIESEIDSDLKAILGASAGTNSDGTIPLDSMAGQLKTMLSDGFAGLWDLGEAIYASLDPNQATGSSLDRVGALTGALRGSGAFSTATVTCTGVPLTVILAGSVVTVTTTGSRFLSITGSTGDSNYPHSTIVAATAWAALTGYSVGDKRTNSGNIYYCITAGTSAGSGGPTTTASDITDGTVHWKYLGPGTGYVNVPFEAESSGAIGALAGTLTTIASPINGWRAAYNVSDAVVGQDQEIDSQFRARRDQELATAGNATPDAIRANILALNAGSVDPAHAPPTACTVFRNDTDLTDSNGLPPHSVEVLVQGGTDADIALEVWNSVGAGTVTYGNQTSTITDSQGNSQTVKWSRPVAVPIYVTGTVKYDASKWPANSDTVVAQAVVSALLTYGATYPIGIDVRRSPLYAAILRGPSQTDTTGTAVVPADPNADPVAGLLEVETLNFSTSASPTTDSQIVITLRQVATFSSSNTNITASTEDP